MYKIKHALGLLLAVLFLAAASCTSEKADNEPAAGGKESLSSRPIRVVTTIAQIADAAQVIGGKRVQVSSLMGPGVDPHLYKASAGDVTLMAQADVIFYNGLHLEGKMAEVFEQMQKRAVRTVAVADAVSRSSLLSPPEFEGNYDPHIWFDVALWMSAVEKVRDELIQMDAENAQTYRQNAEAYLAELKATDEYVKAQAARLDPSRRALITAHDAFNYFGRAYGFEVKGLQGISTATEAGAGDVQRLADFIVEREIPAIFVESTVPQRYIEAVQAAVKSRGFEVKIGGSLFSDAMGNPGTPEGTYIGMVRHNINTIVSALSQLKDPS
ncbi:MAG: metal ABC transporter solute-binding protein, Zn/Mn family [Deltaproteobacteria bacterium]